MSNAYKPVVTPATVPSLEEQARAISAQQIPGTKTLSKIAGVPAQTLDPTSLGYVDNRLQAARAKLTNLAAGDPNVAAFVKSTTMDNIRPQSPNIIPDLPNIRNPINAFTIPKVEEPDLAQLLAEQGIGGDTTDIDIPTRPPVEEPVTNNKVRLVAVRNFPRDKVIFEVSPTVSESRTVEYIGVNPVHMPGSIQVYKRTESRTFTISAKFISRSTLQAQENMKYLQILRGWTMPYFGVGSQFDGPSTDAGASMLGAPPDVLYLYAYTTPTRTANASRAPYTTNLSKIPVVLKSLSFDYPEDVDYISIPQSDPFPVKMEVRLELAETHSPKGYEGFTLSKFKQGQLLQF